MMMMARRHGHCYRTFLLPVLTAVAVTVVTNGKAVTAGHNRFVSNDYDRDERTTIDVNFARTRNLWNFVNIRTCPKAAYARFSVASLGEKEKKVTPTPKRRLRSCRPNSRIVIELRFGGRKSVLPHNRSPYRYSVENIIKK